MASLAASAEVKILSYKYNDNVILSIADVPCPHKEIAGSYPYGAVAKRIDGQYLFGCFKQKDEDNIEIQWVGGDTTVIPANAFLVDENGVIKVPEIKPTL